MHDGDHMTPRRATHIFVLPDEQGAGPTRRLTATTGLSLIVVESRGSKSSPHTLPRFNDRLDKPKYVDIESVLKDAPLGVDGNEPRCAASAIVSHRGRIGTEWRTPPMAEGNLESITLLVQR
jgi:hypothetical protein